MISQVGGFKNRLADLEQQRAAMQGKIDADEAKINENAKAQQEIVVPAFSGNREASAQYEKLEAEGAVLSKRVRGMQSALAQIDARIVDAKARLQEAERAEVHAAQASAAGIIEAEGEKFELALDSLESILTAIEMRAREIDRLGHGLGEILDTHSRMSSAIENRFCERIGRRFMPRVNWSTPIPTGNLGEKFSKLLTRLHGEQPPAAKAS